MTSPIVSELLQRTTALRALARELVGEASADDIVQETAIQAMTAPPKRTGPVGGWLAAVVRNLASKHRRAERIRRRHEADSAPGDVAGAAASPDERSAEDADTLRRLTEIVTELPEPYRGTILARYLREQTPREIAAATDTPLATVKTRLQRGLALLRQRLDERGGDWRALLIGAFALDPAAAAKTSILKGTTMKLALVAATLLPIGYAVWFGIPGSWTTSTETTTGSGGSPAAGAVANPVASTGQGTAGGADRAANRDPGASDRDAAASGLAEGPEDSTAAGAAGASTAQDPELPVHQGLPEQSAGRPAARPLMRLDLVGPAAFRAAFRPTRLGDLCASVEGERLWRPLLAPAERLWQQWDGGGDGFADTRRRVLDYAGRIRVLWLVQPGEGDERDRVFGVFALEPDGSTDLTGLAGDLSRTMQSLAPAEPTERIVGDHRLRLLGAGDGFVSIPVLIGDSLVAFFGEAGSLDRTVPLGLQALAADVARPAAPLSLQVDLTRLRELSEMRSEPPLVKAFGLESLRELQVTVSARGAHAELEVEVVFGDGDRGIMAAFLPGVDTLPKLLARVPAEATPFLTVPFHADVMFRVMTATVAAYSELGNEEVPSDLRQDLHDELGLYLDTELLDHLSGEVMVLGDLWESEDPEVFQRGGDPPLGACIAFSLEDEAAFRRGFNKLLDHLKGVVHQHETREVDGVEITRMGTAFLTGMHMAVGQDLFALAFGREGVAQLEALVATGGPAAAAAEAAVRPLPVAVRRVEDRAPPGWNGVGLADLEALLGGQVTLVLEMLDDMLPPEMQFGSSVGETQEWLERLLPLVAEHQLENIVTMTGYDDGRWRMRVVW